MKKGSYQISDENDEDGSTEGPRPGPPKFAHMPFPAAFMGPVKGRTKPNSKPTKPRRKQATGTRI